MVLEGEIEMLLDVGNPAGAHETERRMSFVLRNRQLLTFDEKEMKKEDLVFAADKGTINPSGNDQ